MSRSCACFSGPPVRRTADKGKGRARSGIAFLICWAFAERHMQKSATAAKKIIKDVGLLVFMVLSTSRISLGEMLALPATTRLTLVHFHCKQASASGRAV